MNAHSRRLYDSFLAVLFGLLASAAPTLFLSLFTPPGPLLFLLSGLMVASVARMAYGMIKKNRAERRFFLDESE